MRKEIHEFRFESARATVTISGERALVSHVYAIVRNQGHATGVLTKVIEFADKNDLQLHLTARGYGRPIQTMLNPDQLRAFYQKFGFVIVQDRYPVADMIRPRKKNTPYSEREN